MSSRDRYDSVAITLHWITGIGIFVIGLTEILRGQLFERGSAPREFLKVLHEPAGLIIFALIAVRIFWRITHQPPAPAGDPTAIEARAAKLVHLALYALMIAIPLLGIATSAARGRPVNFGLFQIASPIERTKDWIGPTTEIHEIAAYALIALAVGHIAAAIYHQVALKDGLLLRMMPERR